MTKKQFEKLRTRLIEAILAAEKEARAANPDPAAAEYWAKAEGLEQALDWAKMAQLGEL